MVESAFEERSAIEFSGRQRRWRQSGSQRLHMTEPIEMFAVFVGPT
jgi:hypothetical protein